MTHAIVLIEAERTALQTLGGTLADVEGVTRTQTMVAFEAFSRHDLEALFDIGA